MSHPAMHRTSLLAMRLLLAAALLLPLGSAAGRMAPLPLSTLFRQESTTLTWTGEANSDWHNANNWSPKNVPAIADDVIIPDRPRHPVLQNGNAQVNRLTLQPGAILDLTDQILTVENTLTNQGMLKQTRSASSGSTTSFIRITNAAGTLVRYSGLELTPITTAPSDALGNSLLKLEPQLAPLREGLFRLEDPATGFIPPPMSTPHLTGQSLPLGVAPIALPASFDWRSKDGANYLTPVKDQENCGACYSFASLGDFEAQVRIATSDTPDFSENNAKECVWEAVNETGGGSCSGGNAYMTANLFSVKGVVSESCDPYVDADVPCNTTCPVQKTLLGWRVVSDEFIPDTDVLKQIIYTHGPIYTAMDANTFRGFHGGYDGSYTFNYTSSAGSVNHAVLIVGWSDQLPPVYGSTTPASGWIVKNSWGTSWGDSGYFYITYGSANIGLYSSYISEWQDFNPQGGLLYHDEAGWNNQLGFSSQTAWGFARFYPASSTSVTRVEFWTPDAMTDVDIYLYDTFDGISLSGLLASKLNLTIPGAGYHSVKLNAPVELSAGNDLIVVVQFTAATTPYPLVFDSEGSASAEQTYVSPNGINWLDLGSQYGFTLGIRARTGPATIPANTPPSLVDLPNLVIAKNSSLLHALDLWAYAHDLESSDSSLQFSIANLPPAGAGVSLDNHYINLSPQTGWLGAADVSVRVTDPGGLSATDAFQVHVLENSGPISVTVSVSGDAFCPGLSSGIRRCFSIQPAGGLSGKVKFYFIEAERNDLGLNQLYAYRQAGDWLRESGPYTRGGSGDAQYVSAENLVGFTSFALDLKKHFDLFLPVAERKRYLPLMTP